MTKADGTASFDTVLQAEVFIPDAAGYSWDIDGDGVPDQAGPALSEITAIYSRPGLYFPTITITDAAGNAFTETAIVNVLGRTTIDNLLKAKWDGMKQEMIQGDIEGALTFFLPDSRTRFRDAFTTLKNSISYIASAMQNTELLSVAGRQ